MNENLNKLIALKKEFWHKHSSNPWESYEKSVEILNVQKALFAAPICHHKNPVWVLVPIFG